jgi:hypothetical protein
MLVDRFAAFEQVDFARELFEVHFSGFEDSRHHPPEANRHNQFNYFTWRQIAGQCVEGLLAAFHPRFRR